MNRKGFTLVEMLAMLVVLGIIMVIAVPNISGIMDNHKTNVTITDASKMVESAKATVSLKYKKKINENDCFVLALNELDKNDDFQTGGNGGTYDMYDSFAVVAYKKGSTTYHYEYYVRIVELVDGKKIGINFSKIEDIENKDNKLIVELDNTHSLKPESGAIDAAAAKTMVNSLKSNLCGNVVGLYLGPER